MTISEKISTAQKVTVCLTLSCFIVVFINDTLGRILFILFSSSVFICSAIVVFCNRNKLSEKDVAWVRKHKLSIIMSFIIGILFLFGACIFAFTDWIK